MTGLVPDLRVSSIYVSIIMSLPIYLLVIEINTCCHSRDVPKPMRKPRLEPDGVKNVAETPLPFWPQ